MTLAGVMLISVNRSHGLWHQIDKDCPLQPFGTLCIFYTPETFLLKSTFFEYVISYYVLNLVINHVQNPPRERYPNFYTKLLIAS